MLIEDDVEGGFFFDLAEGGFGFGFAGFDVAFREAGEAVLLVDDENFAVINDDGAARGFRFSVFWGGAGGVGVAEIWAVGGGLVVG